MYCNRKASHHIIILTVSTLGQTHCNNYVVCLRIGSPHDHSYFWFIKNDLVMYLFKYALLAYRQ